MRRGFSQIEVLVAVAVLSVGLLTLFGVITYHLRAASYAAERAAAASLNQRLIEWVRSRVDFAQPLPPGLQDGPALRRPLNDPPLSSESFTAEELAAYRRNIQVERVSSDPNSYQHRLWRIRVTLFWKDKSCLFEGYQR